MSGRCGGESVKVAAARASSLNVWGSGREAPHPSVPPSGEYCGHLRFLVWVEFLAAVLHSLDVQPHADDPFSFRICFLVAWPVVPGGDVVGEFA